VNAAAATAAAAAAAAVDALNYWTKVVNLQLKPQLALFACAAAVTCLLGPVLAWRPYLRGYHAASVSQPDM
jgi:hypothetical protein